MGRHRKFDNADRLYKIGKKYIDDCLENGKNITFTGLCLEMGMHRETFNDYESGKYDTDIQTFSAPLKELKLRCENYAEERLFANNPTGAIFALKNYGWKDKVEVESNNEITVKFEGFDDL